MCLLRHGIAFTLVLYLNIILCSELKLDDEFVVMDGIRIRKDSIRNETNDIDKSDKKRGTDSDVEGSEDTIEYQDDDDDDKDDDDDEDEEEIDNADDEDLEATKHLPTKCHGM